MKSSGFVSCGCLLAGALAASASAFQLRSRSRSVAAARRGGGKLLSAAVAATVSIDESAPRDIGAVEEWAAACGVQRAEGFQLTSTATGEDGTDVGVATARDLPAGSPVLFVPSGVTLSSDRALRELGRVDAAEDLFGRLSAADQLPQFYLFLKILAEYEMGDRSPWHPWLNSLPRYFSNGSSMTHFCCSECLPPLVGKLALNERTRFKQFFRALKFVDFLSEQTRSNKKLAKWAFAVVYTRSFQVGIGDAHNDVRIVPMADMVRMYGMPK